MKICVYAICKDEAQFVSRWVDSMSEADEIYVLENGKLVEQGSHTQLMQKADGLYRQMFQAQKGMYE